MQNHKKTTYIKYFCNYLFIYKSQRLNAFSQSVESLYLKDLNLSDTFEIEL